MTPNEVFWWTLGLALTIIIMLCASVTAIWLYRKPDRDGLPPNEARIGLICLIGILFPAMFISVMHSSYPGQSVIAYLLYTPEERLAMQDEDALVRRLRPMMRRYVVVCPDASIFEPQNAALLRDWNEYYRSFLHPAPLGKACYYGGTPYLSGIEKPVGRPI